MILPFRITGYSEAFIKLIIIFFGGLFFLYNGLKKLKFKRMIMDLPTSKIKSLAMGFVEIIGKVESCEELLVSPIDKKDCVYFDLHIERYVRRGKRSRWETVKRIFDTSLFYLNDDSDKILIDSNDAELNFKTDLKVQTGLFKEMPKKIKNYCEENEITHQFLGIKQKLRFTEKIIEPNDQLYIMGSAIENDKTELIKDSGSIKIGKSDDHLYYYISDSSEKELLHQFGWKVPLQIFGGAIVAIGALYISLMIAIEKQYI